MPNKPIGGGYLRYPRTGTIHYKRRGGGPSSQNLSIRNHHRVGVTNNVIVARALSRNMYAGKVHKNRKQRRTKDKKLSLGDDGKLPMENGVENVSNDANTVTAVNEGQTEESNGFVIFIALTCRLGYVYRPGKVLSLENLWKKLPKL